MFMFVLSTLRQARLVVVLFTLSAPRQQLVVLARALPGTEAPPVRPPVVPSIYLRFMRKLPEARRVPILLPILI